MQGFRTEKDTFGPLQVPSEKYWGAQTQRSLQNFKICAATDKMPVQVVHAFGLVKKACALVNAKNGKLDKTVGDAIVKAAEEVRRMIGGMGGRIVVMGGIREGSTKQRVQRVKPILLSLTLTLYSHIQYINLN